MVAYSFQRQFAEPILAGTKGGTIRADRRRHARPGEELQLYVGMRTKQCRLVARKTCLAVDPLTINFVAWRVGYVIAGACCLRRPAELDAFAVFDGFASFAEMAEFWSKTHGVHVFRGWHIRWLPMMPPLQRRPGNGWVAADELVPPRAHRLTFTEAAKVAAGRPYEHWSDGTTLIYMGGEDDQA
jgi:hypothetical protein